MMQEPIVVDPRIYEIARSSFDEVDTNHSNTIDINELSLALAKFAAEYGNAPPNQTEVFDSFEFLDKNKDGQIEFEEYLDYIKLVYCGIPLPTVYVIRRHIIQVKVPVPIPMPMPQP